MSVVEQEKEKKVISIDFLRQLIIEMTCKRRKREKKKRVKMVSPIKTNSLTIKGQNQVLHADDGYSTW